MAFITPQVSFLLGIVLASTFVLSANVLAQAKTWATRILQLSVVLLGCSLNFKQVLQDGTTGAAITLISLVLIFAVGLGLMKLMRLERTQGLLLTMGTAICGGSAIAALAPILAAEGAAIGVAMGVVFLLNAIAVYLFPWVGDFFTMTAEQFGLWSALAIHDTSSVVAAASQHSTSALAVATTVKLTRALWIIPLTLIFSLIERKGTKFTVPWFIVGFLCCSLIFTFIAVPAEWRSVLPQISKMGFTLTLFLIGLGFSAKKIKAVGLKPLVFGISLWLLVSVVSFFYVRM